MHDSDPKLSLKQVKHISHMYTFNGKLNQLSRMWFIRLLLIIVATRTQQIFADLVCTIIGVGKKECTRVVQVVVRAIVHSNEILEKKLNCIYANKNNLLPFLFFSSRIFCCFEHFCLVFISLKSFNVLYHGRSSYGQRDFHSKIKFASHVCAVQTLNFLNSNAHFLNNVVCSLLTLHRMTNDLFVNCNCISEYHLNDRLQRRENSLMLMTWNNCFVLVLSTRTGFCLAFTRYAKHNEFQKNTLITGYSERL